MRCRQVQFFHTATTSGIYPKISLLPITTAFLKLNRWFSYMLPCWVVGSSCCLADSFRWVTAFCCSRIRARYTIEIFLNNRRRKIKIFKFLVISMILWQQFTWGVLCSEIVFSKKLPSCERFTSLEGDSLPFNEIHGYPNATYCV